jgi:hypothetical protein
MTRLQELQAQHETLRQAIIARDGAIQIGVSYPELDAISRQMFYILSGGSETLVITEAQVRAMATN